MMKKFVAFLLASMMLVGCLCGCSADSGKEKFVVGFDAAFPPYGYQNEKGEYVGFDLSLAEEVCKRNEPDHPVAEHEAPALRSRQAFPPFPIPRSLFPVPRSHPC